MFVRPWAARLIASWPWGVVTAALLLRFNAGLQRDFWEDEMISVSHADQPAWRLPVEVARNDIHPFLYFFQLHLWGLFSSHDIWLRLNSVSLNLLAILILYAVTRSLYGSRVAIVAASLFSLSAPAVWMSQELRPYSWLFCLIIAAFYFLERVFGETHARPTPATAPLRGGLVWGAADVSVAMRHGFLAGVCCVAIVYSHAIGFLIVFLFGLYSLGRLAEAGMRWRTAMAWASLFGACALLAVPQMGVDMLRDANIRSGGTFASDLTWIPRILLPFGGGVPGTLLSALVYAGVTACGLRRRETRLMTAVFLVFPIAAALLLDSVDRDIFKLNVFSTVITPFLVIIVARLVAPLPALRRGVIAGGMAVLCVAFSLVFYTARPPTTGFRAASSFIRAQARPGDLVYVPQQSLFWGMARYMGTDRHGWALAVAPALNDRWRHMYDRLGPRLVSLFGLMPQTQLLMARGDIPLLVGEASVPRAATASRVWLVIFPRADLPADFPPPRIGTLTPGPTHAGRFLKIILYRQAGGQ